MGLEMGLGAEMGPEVGLRGGVLTPPPGFAPH